MRTRSIRSLLSSKQPNQGNDDGGESEDEPSQHDKCQVGPKYWRGFERSLTKGARYLVRACRGSSPNLVYDVISAVVAPRATVIVEEMASAGRLNPWHSFKGIQTPLIAPGIQAAVVGNGASSEVCISLLSAWAAPATLASNFAMAWKCRRRNLVQLILGTLDDEAAAIAIRNALNPGRALPPNPSMALAILGYREPEEHGRLQIALNDILRALPSILSTASPQILSRDINNKEAGEETEGQEPAVTFIELWPFFGRYGYPRVRDIAVSAFIQRLDFGSVSQLLDSSKYYSKWTESVCNAIVACVSAAAETAPPASNSTNRNNRLSSTKRSNELWHFSRELWCAYVEDISLVKRESPEAFLARLKKPGYMLQYETEKIRACTTRRVPFLKSTLLLQRLREIGKSHLGDRLQQMVTAQPCPLFVPEVSPLIN